MTEPIFIRHPLAPIYNRESRVLILGTMPSPASRSVGFYYGHPQNRFWRALCTVLEEPLPPDPAAKTQLLLRRHIALWDTLAGCRIAGASDASIRDAVPNDFSPIFSAAPIRQVFTTGKKSYALYRKYVPDTPVGVQALASPSPANCAVSFAALCQDYRRLLPFLED